MYWSNFHQRLRIQNDYQQPLYIHKEDRWKYYLAITSSGRFCTGCTEEQDEKSIYNLIGTKIQFKSEQEKGDIPFEYLGLVKDYKGTDLVQTKKYIEMNYSNYIAWFLKFHGWDVASDQPYTAPTTVTNSKTWNNWMEAK